MPDYTPGQKQLLSVYGSIQAGSDAGLTTAELWSATVNALYDQTASRAARLTAAGDPAAAQRLLDRFRPGPFGFQDMNTLRAMAGSMTRSSRLIAKARAGDEISPNMIGRQPWSADLAQHALAPAWEVSYQHITEGADPENLPWLTNYYEGALPPTVGSLLADLNDVAALLATDVYNTTHVGIGDVRIAIAGHRR